MASLKITFAEPREGYAPQQLMRLSLKVPKPECFDLHSYSKEYAEFVEYFNAQLDEAFKAGREFERSYKPEEDE